MSAKEILISFGLLGAAAVALDPSPQVESIRGEPQRPADQPDQTESSVYYAGCNDVRAAGKAPLYAGEPGYREGMDGDGDGDGIACEPHR